ncbi:hypothetical protein [Sorangium sp. So ce124]|uniref:hypothetical protein n=1 Tax=Sorangium sp. So ce124 TaxID=3133280 RepID=UPI003F5FB7CA
MNSEGDDDLLVNPRATVKVAILPSKKRDIKRRLFLLSCDAGERPELSRFLLDLGAGQLTGGDLDHLPEDALRDLLDVGVLVPSDSLSLRDRLRRKLLGLVGRRREPSFVRAGRRLAGNPRMRVGMFLSTKTLNQPPVERVFEARKDYAFCSAILASVAAGGAAVRVPRPAPLPVSKLVDVGFLVPSREAPRANGLLACRVEDLTDLVPRGSRAASERQAAAGGLVLNREIIVQRGARVPGELVARVGRPRWVSEDLPDLWVGDPITRALSIYWLRPEHKEIVQALVEGRRSPADLDSDVLALLSRMDVLVPKDDEARRGREWRERFDSARESLRRRRCALIPDMLHPLQLALWRRYCRKMYDERYLRYDDDYDTKGRYYLHDEDASWFLQEQACSILNRFLPSPVKPVSNFFAVYREGAFLGRHTDGQEVGATHAMSVLIDTEPEVGRSDAWPLCLSANGRTERLLLRAGDAALFDPHVPHWRDRLQGHGCAVMIFWFVPADFRGYFKGQYIGERAPVS